MQEQMDRIFLVNKPKNKTSRDIVNAMIKKFGNKKMGHAGTLDPFATGLLLIVVGKATKIVPFLEKKDKHYIATLRLGIKTDTLDITGNVLETREVPKLSKKTVLKTLKSFIGELEQIPPMYSALKHDGVPLYKLARENIEVERKSRTIRINNIRLIRFDNNEIRFSVDCSKGTYVRTLGEQIAERLNTIGTLVDLKRTKIGDFNLKNAKSVKNITLDNSLSIVEALNYMDVVVCDENVAKNVKDGRTLILEHHAQQILLIDEQNNALAVYEKVTESRYKCARGLF